MELIQFYQTSFFCDLADVTPKPELIIELTKKLKKFELIPSSAPELVIDEKGITTNSRLELTSQKKDFVIRFEKNRFLIEQSNLNNNIITIDEFKLKAKSIFEILYSILERKGKRLSFVTSTLLNEKNDKKLNENFKQILVPQSIYKVKIPYEWNTRQVTTDNYKIKNESEKINIIIELSRVHGLLNEKGVNKKIDRLQFSTDINTHQSNMSPRFDSNDFGVFLQQSTNQFKKLKKEYGDLLK